MAELADALDSGFAGYFLQVISSNFTELSKSVTYTIFPKIVNVLDCTEMEGYFREVVDRMLTEEGTKTH